MSWSSWLTYSGRSTLISGYPLSVGRAQNSKSSAVKDQRSTAEPRNQPVILIMIIFPLILQTISIAQMLFILE